MKSMLAFPRVVMVPEEECTNFDGNGFGHLEMLVCTSPYIIDFLKIKSIKCIV